MGIIKKAEEEVAKLLYRVIRPNLQIKGKECPVNSTVELTPKQADNLVGKVAPASGDASVTPATVVQGVDPKVHADLQAELNATVKEAQEALDAKDVQIADLQAKLSQAGNGAK